MLVPRSKVSGLGWMAASRQGLGFPLVAAVSTVGCTEALMTGRSTSQEGLRLLRPLHLLPDPAATHITSALLRTLSPAVNPELARGPISSKGFHIGHHLRCPQHTDKLLNGCFSSHHTAEEAEGLPRDRASLRLSRSGKPRAPIPTWDTGSSARCHRDPGTPTFLYLPCSNVLRQTKISWGKGLPCLETSP